jgi:hypothetical protein
VYVADPIPAIGYFKAFNTEHIDWPGASIALSDDGSTLAVGASGKADARGAVYVFTRSGSIWLQQACVTASNAESEDFFGIKVTLSANGSTLAVGAPLEDSDGSEENNSASNSGAVYVFTRSENDWVQQDYIKASNTEADDQFGVSLSLSADGSTLAVGASGKDSSSGAVYVFIRSGLTWSQQAYIEASNPLQNNAFGISLSLSANGSTLAVGADCEGSNATGIDGDQTEIAPNSGAVYVFTRSGSTWIQQAYVKASNTGEYDHFGYSLALSNDGSILAVGAHLEDSNATGIHEDDGEADNSARDSGAVYVFTSRGGAWSQVAYVKASNTGVDDWFGYSVALSGDGSTLSVGAVGEDSNVNVIDGDQDDETGFNNGAVYLY